MSNMMRDAYDPSSYDYDRTPSGYDSKTDSRLSRMSFAGPEADRTRYRDNSEKRQQQRLKLAQIAFWTVMGLASLLMATRDAMV